MFKGTASIAAALQTLLACLLLNSATDGLEPTTRVYRVGVSGSSVSLPCQLPSLPAPPALVLWYRGASTKPFYSFDGRGNEGSGSHKIHDASLLGRRTSFSPTYRGQPYQGVVGDLEVRNLSLSDAGNFTCRVDFLQYPTMMTLLTLQVHEPVKHLSIVDIYENEVLGVAGPYQEQASLYLKCRATGGFPQPDLEWIIPESTSILEPGPPSSTSSYSLSSFTSSSYTSAYSGTGRVEAVLQVAELRRGDQGRRFTCRANNSALITPSTRTVTLEMHYGPVAVELYGLESALVAGVMTEVECRTGGSRPPPRVIWTPENLFESLGPPIVTDSGNLSVSRARLLPSWEDDGRTVSCTATNTDVPQNSLAATRTLVVKYPPRVEAHLVRTLDPDNIKEGDDAFFMCPVKANPTPKTIVWLHQDKEVVEDTGPGGRLFQHGHDLVFQGLLRAAEGEYRCRATNDLGTATSAPALLRVQYAPECKEPANVTVSVSPDEEVPLNCRVDSSFDKVKFRWALNTSKGLSDFDPSRFSSEGLSSLLTHRPYSYQIIHDHTQDNNNNDLEGDEDKLPPATESFGVVYCWAHNRIGWQKEPCTFTVRPAGPPGELVSCSLVNQSATSLSVSCVPGHNGGLQQSFSVKVLDEVSGALVANVTSPRPEVVVNSLAPGRDYLVEVRAVNAKGASSPVTLQGFALKVAENKIHALSPGPSAPLLLPVFAGVLTGLLLVALLLIVTTRARHRGRVDKGQMQQPGEHAPLSASSHGSLDEDEQMMRPRSPGIGFKSRPHTPATPQSIGSSLMRSYMPVDTTTGLESPKSPTVPSTRQPSLGNYQALGPTTKSCGGSLNDGPTLTPPQTSPMDSPLPDEEEGGPDGSRAPSARLTGSLPRQHSLRGRGQPLTALVDRVGSPGSLGGSSAASHQCYTLKINCTRRHNESFV